ncbi:replication initiation protein RepC [Bacillus subtilis]|uniref:plasmid replication protein RepC n=1 Tax=Pseudochrobactrum asaccharolyticum TaxID=354351 RepID=UPI001F3C7525|nr:plasmid replication protein RepC [Pseudochrobactrum asaccharolyticum]MCF7646811.1 replication initiation protein RepC [Pseudochrobactrum asaccharolyticum]MCF7672636.1 replication initiation protein RepC [Bacillus subtilis]
MTEHFATSPFGGRMINAAHFLSYEKLRQQKQNLRQNSIQTENTSERTAVCVDRWKLLRALTEAREAYQLSSRSIAVLEALLSFYPDKILDGSVPLIVFPSNHELSMRLRGMSAPTIRRHIATLVEIGFILRRDSPNGKRFVRRDSNGEIAMAFGFDLAPLTFRAAEIETQAEKIREENRIRQQLRFSITIHLRDISKTILSALNENREGDWEALYDQLQALSGRVERNGTLSSLTIREQALSNLRRQVENLYLSNVSEPQMSGNERENEHHIQNSSIESFDKTKPIKTEKSEIQIADKPTTARAQIKTPHLNEILNRCPQIKNYAVHGIQNWKDLVTTAGHIRSMLGITLSAWQQACESMGEINAAVTVAALLERSDTIHSAGGYLRKLSQKAEIGQYSVQPVLRALSQTKH